MLGPGGGNRSEAAELHFLVQVLYGQKSLKANFAGSRLQKKKKFFIQSKSFRCFISVLKVKKERCTAVTIVPLDL